ncbi:hypothetical protein RQP46_011296 [Phenoliferia psychrophenolica]
MPTMGFFYLAAVLSLTPSILATVLPRDAFVYKGCFSDSANGRTLPTRVTGSAFVGTPSSCVTACKANFQFCGVENGNECWGTNTMKVSATYGQSVPESSCQAACTGDATQFCGGQNAIGIWAAPGTVIPTTPAPVAPTNVVDDDTYTYKTCYKDNSAGSRELATRLTSGDGSAKGCLAACKLRSFNLCGIEYGGECWGNNFLTAAYDEPNKAGQTSCTMTCGGGTPYACGGSNALSLYVKSGADITATRAPLSPSSGYSYQSCLADSSARIFSNALSNPAGTATACLSACNAAGFAFCGIEYGATTPSTQCNMACTNEDQYLCGGSFALTTYAADCTATDSNAATCAPGGASKTCKDPVKFAVRSGLCRRTFARYPNYNFAGNDIAGSNTFFYGSNAEFQCENYCTTNYSGRFT